MRTHHFDSTEEAYDACQCDDRIKDGDVLVILDECVVGIADTWPFAITLQVGKLHHVSHGITDAALAKSAGIPLESIAAARAVAAELGYGMAQ